MDISSLLQSIGIYQTSTTSSATVAKSKQSIQDTQYDAWKAFFGGGDTVTISAEGMALSKMPPPPQKLDFTNMSDNDLISHLEKIQEMTGSIPGVEDGTSASELTSEQLQSIRELLANMPDKTNGMRGMGKMQSPPPMDIQDLSDDSLKSFLESIKEKTGSIPGIEDSESIEVSSLTDEQLQSARSALLEMMMKRMEGMMLQL